MYAQLKLPIQKKKQTKKNKSEYATAVTWSIQTKAG